MAKRVNTAWTQGLSPDEKLKVEGAVLTDTILLDRLSKILYNMQEKRETTVLGDYDSPSWSHKQAHINGQLDVIKQLQEILSIQERADQPTLK
jgi:hypothetical protein